MSQHLRGDNFSPDKTRDLLYIAHQVAPQSKYDWELIANYHVVNWPGRNFQGLRRKIAALARRMPPTGDPDIPEPIRIVARVDVESVVMQVTVA